MKNTDQITKLQVLAVFISMALALIPSACNKKLGPEPVVTPTCYTEITTADADGIKSYDPDDWKTDGDLADMFAVPNPSDGDVFIIAAGVTPPAYTLFEIYDCSRILVSTFTSTAEWVTWTASAVPGGARLPDGMYRCYVSLNDGTSVTARTYGDIQLTH